MKTVSRKNTHPSLTGTLVAFGAIFLLCGVAKAQNTYTYNPNGYVSGTDSWTAGTNWSTPPTSGSANTLTFLPAGGTFLNTGTFLDINANDLATQPFLLNVLNLSGVGSSTANAPATVTIQSGTLNFVDNGASTPVLNLNATNGTSPVTYNINSAIVLGDNLTIAGSGNAAFNIGGSITSGGSFGLIMNATGTLVLSGSNNITGATALNAGILNVGNANALAGGGTITFGGGELQYSAANQADYSGRIVGSGSAITIGLNGQTVTYATALAASNTGGLTLISASGTGTLILTAANLYTGVTTITSGTLQLGNGTSGSDGTISSVAVVDNSALVYNRFGATSAAYNITGTGSVTVKGSGTQTLSGNNAYSGATNITSGVLQAGSITALSGSSAFVLATPGILDLDTFSNSIGSLAGSGTVTNSGFSLATLTLGGNNTVTNFSGLVQNGNGGLALTKIGTGTFSLSGATNTYQGATTINAGALLIADTASLGTQGDLGVVLNGGLLGFISGTNTLSDNFTLGAAGSGFISVNAADILTLSGTLSGSTLTLGGAGSTLITNTVNGSGASDFIVSVLGTGTTNVSGTISNGGGFGLQKAGAGVLVLSSTQSYSGDTTITSGTLLVTGSGLMGTQDLAGLVLNGGRFGFTSGTNTISNSYTLGAPGSGFTSVNAADSLTLSGILSGSTLSIGGSGSTAITGTVNGNGASDLILSVIGSGTTTVSGNIANTGGFGLQKSGGGVLVLSSTENYSGNTTINQGSLLVTGTGLMGTQDLAGLVLNGGVFGFTSGTNTISNSYTLGAPGSGFTTVLASDSLTLSGNLTGNSLTIAGPGATNLSGTFIGTGTGNATFNVTATGSTTVTGGIVNSGSFGLIKSGAGTLTILTGADSYTGTTTLAAGILNLGNAAALPAGTNITFTGGTLQYSAANQNDYSAYIFGSTSAIKIGVNGQTITFATGLDASNTGGLTLQDSAGGGSLTLTGSNLYTGPTTIASSILVLAGGGSLASTTPVVLGAAGGTSGTFQLGNAGGAVNQTVAGLKVAAGAGTANAVVGGNSAVSTLTVNNTGNNTYSGILGGVSVNQNNLALTLIGTGTLTLSGSNSYTGTTTLGGAVLSLGNAGALGGGGSITFAGGTLQYSGSNTNDHSSRIVNSGSAMRIDVNGQAVTYSSALAASDTGGLTVLSTAPGGTLTLNASEAYTGATTVLSGQLLLGASGTLNSSTALVLGGAGGTSGTFVMNSSGHNQTVTSLASGAGAGTANEILGGNATTTGTLIINSASGATTFTGTIGGATAASNNIAILMEGSGEVFNNGIFSGTGGMTVQSGTFGGNSASSFASTINLGNASTPAGGATIEITNGGAYANNITTSAAAGSNPLTLKIDNGATLSGTLALNNNLTMNIFGTTTISGSVNLTSGNLILAPNNNGATVSGKLSGTDNVVVEGIGTGNVTLTGAQGQSLNWTGALVVNSGSVNVPGSQSPYNLNNAIVVNAGANWGGAGVGNSTDIEAGWASGSFNAATNSIVYTSGTNNGSLTFSRANTIAGSGTYSYGGVVNVNTNSSYTKDGAGTQSLSGSSFFGTSPITVNAGTLDLSNPYNPATSGTTLASSISAGTITIQGGAIAMATVDGSPLVETKGPATLQFSGNYLVTGPTTFTIASSGSNTVSLEDGTVNYGQLNNLTQINTVTFAGSAAIPLTFSGTANLLMDVGATADQMIFTSGSIKRGTVGVTINGFGVLNGGTQTLITSHGDTTVFTIGAGNNFNLAATTGNMNGYVVSLVSPSNGVLDLKEVANVIASGSVFWTGTQATAAWNAFSGGNANNSNWSTTLAGTSDPHALPGSTNDVYFSASNGANFNTSLGLNFSIQGLYFTNVGSAVTINGGTNTLTIGTDGINVQGSAPNPTINANVILGGNQTWTDNSGQILSVAGSVSGAHNLVVTGTGATAGEFLLGGADSFSSLTINENALVETNAAGVFNSSQNVTFGSASTGTLDLNGFSQSIGSLSTNAGSPGSAVLQNNNATGATLSVTQTTNGTFAGVMQNGAAGGSLGFIKAGGGALALSGANTYTGSTNVNGGLLNVQGSIGSGNVSINSGTLAGTGTIGGSVTVTSTGEITSTVGTSALSGTLTLSSGLTIATGGIAAFNIATNGSANDEILVSGSLAVNNDAIFEVTNGLTVNGTFALMTFGSTNLSSGTQTGIIGENLNAQPLPFNYTFVVNGNTLDLVVVPNPLAAPGITITIPSNNTRQMENQVLALSGSIFNSGTQNALSGTLSSTGTLTVSNLTPPPVMVPSGSAVAYSGSLNTGASLGNQNYAVTVMDGSANPTSASATGTTDVVQNRVVTTTTSPAFGALHVGSVASGTLGLVSPGADSQNTRVTVASSTGTDSNGILYSGNNTGTFNGSYSASGTVSGTFATLGSKSGTFTLTTTGEGLAGESPVNVTVNYSASIFSGQATWNNIGGNGVWSTNNNWGDTNVNDLGGIGAPGLSGTLSVGDTAIFGDNAGEMILTTVSLNGANPSLAGLTFNSGSTSYTIAAGTGGALSFQAGASITTTTGSATIAANFTSAGGLTINGPGMLVTSGSFDQLVGTATIASGTFEVLNPSTLAQVGASTYQIVSGATMELSNSGTLQNWSPANQITFTGNGTLLINPGGPGYDFEIHNNFTLGGSGGTIEIASGTLDNGGPLGGGSITWSTTDTLQLDVGAFLETWDGANPTFGALSGTGTITRYGYGEGSNTINLGNGNGSGTFAGSIINQLGANTVTKSGTGLQVFSGSNGYSGQTLINAGTLRITNGAGLGFGDLTGVGNANLHSTSITNAALDINGGITLNNKITLNAGGILINSAAGTTSVLDSGIAGVTFAADPNVAGTYSLAFSGGSGVGATGTAGTEPNLAEAGNNGGFSNSLYAQVLTGGSGYTPGNAPTATITGTQGTVGGATAVVVSQLILSGTGDLIGGNGNLTINAQISGAGFTTTGTGTLTLTGSNIYAGPTTVATGVLNIINSNGSTGSGAVNITSGTIGTTATLEGTGMIAGVVTTSATSATSGVAIIAPGVNTSGNFGGVGTLTLNGGLTLGNGSNLDFDLGNSSDLIVANNNLTLGTGIVLNISQGAGFAGNTVYNLITYTGGLSGDASTWTATGGPIDTTAVFSTVSGTSVTVDFTPTNIPAVAYWGGAQGNNWSTITGTLGTNWLNAQSGGSDTTQIPYSITDVYFIADSGSNVNTVLGQNITINSLNFTGTDGVVTTGSAVTIGGTNTLTIMAAGGTGITTGVGAGAELISANVALGGNAAWTLNASAPFTVTGTISGAHALTVGGSGELVLGGNNTFTGGLTIDNTANVLVNNAGALNTAAPESVTFGVASSGSLTLNGNSITIGSLSSDPSATSSVIRNASGTAALLTIDQTLSGTYAGVIRDGAGGGALSLAMGASSTAPLTLTGSNSYTGSTTVNGGGLYVNGSLASTAPVTVNSSGTLGGIGGTIHGAVTVNSGGEITASVGSSSPTGTLTLSGGLTINNGGIAAFNVINGGANDLINITSGGLTLNSGAIIEVSPGLSYSGTYALMTYSGTDPSLAGITEQDLYGAPLTANYSFVANSGTLDLVIYQPAQAFPIVTLNTPTAGTRLMASTTTGVAGTVLNDGSVNTLTGTLSSGGVLSVTGFSPNPDVVGPVGSGTFGATLATGTNLGRQTYSVIATDGNAYITSATATGTVDVVQNRVVTANNIPNYGSLHKGTVLSSTFGLTSPGADNQNTRVTVADSGPDAFGISIIGGNPSGTFNGSFSDTRTISGTLNTLGSDSGITLITTGEGLAGESPINVDVNFNAQIFSGKASWNNTGSNASWATNSNWGDTQAPLGTPGAPGLSGTLSIGDTATFSDFAGETISSTVNLNGVSPSLAGITFNSASTSYTIGEGSGTGSINLQSGATVNITTGTATIAANISGTGPITISGSAGTDMIWSGSDGAFTGSANIASGTLTLVNPTWFGSDGAPGFTGSSNIWNISAGAVLQWDGTGTSSVRIASTNHFSGIVGSGTFQITGTSPILESSALLYLGMSSTGVMEITNGATYVNGGFDTAGINNIPANMGNLQIDSTGVYNESNVVTMKFNALTGSGTVTRIGSGNGGGGDFQIGVAGGSGTFAGTVTNGLGTTYITKLGGGTEAFTGSNSFSGQMNITGGVVRINNNYGLGWGGQTFTSAGANNQHFTIISGSGTLDMSGNLDINEVVQLNGGAGLTNSAVGTTAVLDSGLAGLTFPTDPNSTGTNGITISGGSGNGATATEGQETAYANYVNGGTSADYLQLLTSGTGYTTGTGAPTVTLTVGGSNAGMGAITASVSSLAISGSNNTIGGAGNLLINAQITGASGIATVVGSGTVTLTANELYTGTMNASSGVLVVNASLPGVVNVTGGTLSGTGTISGAVTATSGGIDPGVIGGVGTLTLSNGLTLGAGTNLAYSLGTTQSLMAVTGQLTLGSGITVNIASTGGILENTPYTLITYSGSLTGNTSGWTETGFLPANTVATFASGGGVVTVDFTPINIPGNAYWSGALGSGGNGTWNSITGGTMTNWLTVQNGGTDTNQTPYSPTNVFFIANSGSNVNTVLGQNITINSLNFTGTNGVVTTGSAVTIGGANTLTILATGTNGNTAGSGITTGVGAGAELISANLALGGNQTWTLNSAAPFTVTGSISGSHALTVAGSGELVLGGNDTFTGGLTINNSATVLLNNAGALNSSAPNSVTFGASSSGVLDLNGYSVSIGSLSSAASATSTVIEDASGSAALLTVNQASSGSFAGVIKDGAGGGALSVVKAGASALTLTGANTYSGSTTINGGGLYVNGSLASTAPVTVNSSGTLGGSGGSIAGAVTVNSGGEITSTVGTGTSSPGTLTLGSGLTISGTGIAAFNIVQSGANDEINMSGGLTLNTGAILEVTKYLTVADTYALVTYSGTDPSLAGITFENLQGGALASNYSFVANSGTLDLVITGTNSAIAAISVNGPSAGTRLMAGTTFTVSGSVGNLGSVNNLSGTLSNGGGSITTGDFTPPPITVAPGSQVAYTGSATTSGTALGNQTVGVTVTDGNALLNPTATATGTVDVVQNRVVTPTMAFNTGTNIIGAVHVGSVVTGTVMLSSTGADNQNTRVTVANSSGPDAFGISYVGNNTGTFNGSYSATGTISGTLNTLGTDSGITLTTTGEGLAGEAPINVAMNFNAEVYSGKASWNNIAANGVWSTGNNWGDTQAPLGTPGAPGISGSLSVGDTALFGDYSGTEPASTGIDLAGATASLAGLTFSATNTSYTISNSGTAGSIALQNNATMNVTSGTATIGATISGSGPLTVSGSAGTDMIWSGSNLFTGSTNIASGMLTVTNPSWIGQHAGANIFNINSGAVLNLVGSNTEDQVQDATTIEGSGTLQVTGGLIGFSAAKLAISMASGGVIEVGAGGYLQNGGNGGGGIIWANNLGSLVLDAGGSIDTWDNVNQVPTFDVLSGSGTVTREGYGTGGNGITIGANNGSGTFAGTITNQLGTNSVIKEGSGLQVFSGTNSYSGSTAITGGTLRITNNSGLGWGGEVFVSQPGQLTSAVSGGATLDISGSGGMGITLNNVVTLNGGSLVNNTVGTTSVLDNGIAGVTFTGDPNAASTYTVTITGSGGGSGATATAGTQVGNNGAGGIPFEGGGAANLFTQMTTAGTGYTQGNVTATITNSGSAAVGGTVRAVVSSLILDSGSPNYVGGNGDLTINAQISGAGGFTTVGTGTVTLTNAETYTGQTTLGVGSTLQLGTGYSSVGVIGGAGSVLVSGSGTLTFAGVNTYTGNTTISSSSTLQLGNGVTDGAILDSGTVNNGGALVFDTKGIQNMTGQLSGTGKVTMIGTGDQELSGANNYTGSTFVNSGTLQVGSASALGNTPTITVASTGALSFTNSLAPQTITLSGSGQSLVVNSGGNLGFGVANSGADELVISGGATMSVSGTIYIDPILLTGTGINTPTVIISDAAGGLNNATFELGPLPALSTGSITQTGTTVSITFTGVSTVYWVGGGTSTPGFWSDYSNFTSDAAGTTQISGSFGATQDIVFSGSNAANQTAGTNFLDDNITAKSLTIIDPAGVDIGNGNNKTLTIAGIYGTTGINVGAAAGAAQAEIDANIDFTGTPNITVNNSGGLLITGIISGSNGILVNGSGLLVLTGSNNYTGGTLLESGTLNVDSGANFGVSGSGNGVTFDPGAGNSVTLQSGSAVLTTAPNRTFTFLSGTTIIDPGPSGYVMTISGPVLGSAALEVIDTGELVLSGSVAFNGTAYVTSGTLALAYPGTLAQTGSSVFNTVPGGTVALEIFGGAQNMVPAAGQSVAFTGNGTLLVSGPGDLQVHGEFGANGSGTYVGNGNVYMDMSGGTIEVSGGAVFQNGGGGATLVTEGDPTIGSGSPLWSGSYNGSAFTNLASLQIDAGSVFDVWNGSPVFVDALIGTGTLSRLGYYNATTDNPGSVVTIGDNNGSGEFDGVVTNAVGTLNLVKTGTGTEIFTGSNSYSGSTLVTGGGVLRITNGAGLGFGGQAYYSTGTNIPNSSVTVTGSSTLDMNGGITVDKAITLNGGSLINSGAGTSVLDNGVAAVVISGAQSGTYTTPNLSGSGGTGSGATFAAGSGTSPGAGANNEPVVVYGEVTAAGTGYTVAPTLSFTDSSGSGSGVTATAVLSSLTLTGNGNFMGGNGNLTINAAISGTGGFTEVGSGTLTLTGSSTYTGNTTIGDGDLVNEGHYFLVSGQQLTLSSSGSGASNYGVINMSGATINGSAALTNNAGGNISGYGTISAPLVNTGTISPSGAGTLNITQAFTNAGVIQLASMTANLTGGTITNNALIEGYGGIGSNISNSGTIQPSGGILNLNGTLTNTSTGLITAGAGSEVLVSGGLAVNSGSISLSGGIFDNGGNAMNNSGTIAGYGTLRVGTGANGLTNNGSIAFTGGVTTVNGDITNSAGKTISVSFNPATFTGNVTNNGTFDALNTTVTFSGTFNNNGLYYSDPSTQGFVGLTVGTHGALQGGAGDVYQVNGNVSNASTQAASFNLKEATLTLEGTVNHQFKWSGADLGAVASGYNDNFSIGTLEVQSGGALTIDGENGTNATGVGIYVSVLQLDGGLAQIGSITGDGADIYYDPTQAGNAYLDDQTYALAGGGELTAAIPEPGTMSLLSLGMLMGLGLLGRRKRK